MSGSKKISLAYSPDSDDAFMVYALREKKIDLSGFEFDFVIDDIQRLNKKAQESIYDITAISVAAYPYIAKDYELMPIGASVGQKFGPAVVVNEDSGIANISDLCGKKIAIPGLQTTAFLAATVVLPEFTAVPMHFLEIEEAVKNNTVDAGILIHELQLTCEENGFKKLSDLGTLWFEKTGLPLPLGANAIRRSLGQETISKLSELYRDSIKWGLQNREATLSEASKKAVAGLSGTLADEYIQRYVNDDSLDFSKDVMAGINQLFDAGAKRGLFEFIPHPS